MKYVVDTHVLYWYLFSPEKLPRKVDRIISDAEKGEGIIIVPVIVLAEMLFIFEKKKVRINFDKFVRELEAKASFRLVSFNRRQLMLISELKEVTEMHDRMIASAAIDEGASILSRDRNLGQLKDVKVVW